MTKERQAGEKACPHDSRKVYRSPRLTLYGPISELTRTGGTHGAADALHGAAGKTG